MTFKSLICNFNFWIPLLSKLNNFFSFVYVQEIEELSRLEETSLSSDLSQGYALKSLTGNLQVTVDSICLNNEHWVFMYWVSFRITNCVRIWKKA